MTAAVHRGEAAISAVNLCEVGSNLIDRGFSFQAMLRALDDVDLEIVPFDRSSALAAAALRRSTRHLGLSLADRACLAVAQQLGVPALTTDRAWAGLRLGIDIQLIR